MYRESWVAPHYRGAGSAREDLPRRSAQGVGLPFSHQCKLPGLPPLTSELHRTPWHEGEMVASGTSPSNADMPGRNQLGENRYRSPAWRQKHVRAVCATVCYPDIPSKSTISLSMSSLCLMMHAKGGTLFDGTYGEVPRSIIPYMHAFPFYGVVTPHLHVLCARMCACVCVCVCVCVLA